MGFKHIISGERAWMIIAGLIAIFALCRWAGCDFKSRPQKALDRLQPMIDERALEIERSAK
jgi:hypothetical protein